MLQLFSLSFSQFWDILFYRQEFRWRYIHHIRGCSLWSSPNKAVTSFEKTWLTNKDGFVYHPWKIFRKKRVDTVVSEHETPPPGRNRWRGVSESPPPQLKSKTEEDLNDYIHSIHNNHFWASPLMWPEGASGWPAMWIWRDPLESRRGSSLPPPTVCHPHPWAEAGGQRLGCTCRPAAPPLPHCLCACHRPTLEALRLCFPHTLHSETGPSPGPINGNLMQPTSLAA